jgi:hypothetical protein
MDGLGIYFGYWIALYYYYIDGCVYVLVECLVSGSFRSRTSRRSVRAYANSLKIQNGTSRNKRENLSQPIMMLHHACMTHEHHKQ